MTFIESQFKNASDREYRMANWPRSRSTQALIAFAGAIFSSISIYKIEFTVRLGEYIREFPKDGQDGLAAWIDGLQAGGIALVSVFALLLFLQWLLTRR